MVPGEDPLAAHAAQQPPLLPSKTIGMAGKFAGAFRRQTEEEREARRRKAERSKRDVGRSKTVSGRMDVIDQMDLSGIHGSSMFHHDSPYDACSPHANRSSRRAPVKAFDPNTDTMIGLSLGPKKPSSSNGDRGARSESGPLGPSALQRADMVNVDEKGAEYGKERPKQLGGRTNRRLTSLRLPSLPLSGSANSSSAVDLPASDAVSLSTESSNIDRDTDAERDWRQQQGYWTQPSSVPANRADVSNPVSDVWGVTSEPWQDFAQPKAKSRWPSGATGSRSMLGPYGAGDGNVSAASSIMDMEAVMMAKTPVDSKRHGQDGQDEIAGVSPFPEPDYSKLGGAYDSSQPKRSKSLIKRIKSARQYGNVPPPDDDVLELQGRRTAQRSPKHSPSSPPEGSKLSNSGGDWLGLTTPNLGAGSGTGNLGRHGTRGATKEEQARSSLQPRNGVNDTAGGSSSPSSVNVGSGGYIEVKTGSGAACATSPGLTPGEEAGGYSSADGRSGRTSEAKGSSGLGRSGSIFGRFGRKKSNDTRGILTSRS